MALIAVLKTWIDNEELTAPDLNAEFVNIVNALSGGTNKNLKTVYNNSDLPTYELSNSAASGVVLKLVGSASGGKALIAGDGTTADLLTIFRTGVVESKVTTGTAPFIVASTTKVTNLNADTVDGKDGAALLVNNVSSQTITAVTANEGVLKVTSDTQGSFEVEDTGAPANEQRFKITTLNGFFHIEQYNGSSWDKYLTIEVSPSSGPKVQFPTTLQVDVGSAGKKQTLTDQATLAWDSANGPFAVVTLGGNRTLNAITGAVQGATYMLEVIQDGTGARTLTFGSAFKHPNGAAPDLSERAASDRDLFACFCYDGTNFIVTHAADVS